MQQPGSESLRTQAVELLRARLGFGPLLQRDYWAVVRDSRMSPSQLVGRVSAHFAAFAPRELVVFTRDPGRHGPMRLGEELEVRIGGAVRTGVRVLCCDAQSFTVGTVRGHPEAGRITFGAYRNRRGDVVFHIRSRARSSSRSRYLGFLGVGEAMQTRVWADFINRVAAFAGSGVLGFVHAETRTCADEPDEVATAAPTYAARGD